ncbi:MAG: hypothetical protein EOP04_03070 [Proteobacteria bacterium]|nr:MAG: hypothetical protein EOP04_03070 [Pseudomonadota bacterium]
MVSKKGLTFDKGWDLLRTSTWRARCFVKSPAVHLLSSGNLFVSIGHLTTWNGELTKIGDVWETELFTAQGDCSAFAL